MTNFTAVTERTDRIAPYLAEVGGVGFVASATVLVAGLAVDMWRPGTFFSYVAPQHVAAAMIAFGALALLRREPSRRSSFSRIRFLLVGMLLAAGAHVAAYRYFESFGPVGARLALASAFAVMLPVILFRNFGKEG